jgi:hypothetical protein
MVQCILVRLKFIKIFFMANYILKRPLKYKSIYLLKFFLKKKRNYLNNQRKKNYYTLLTFFENFYSWRLNISRQINYSKQIILNKFLRNINFCLNYVVFKLVVKDAQEFLFLRDFFFKNKLILNLISKRTETYLRNQSIDFAEFKFLFNGGYTGIVFFDTSLDISNFFDSMAVGNDLNKILEKSLIPIYLKHNGHIFSILQYNKITALGFHVSKHYLFNSVSMPRNLFKLFLLNWSFVLHANTKSIV